MAIFISSNCLSPGVRETVDLLLSHGITNIELGPSQEYDDGIEDYLASLKEARFIIHNYFPTPRHPFILNLASDDREIRQKSLAQAKKSIKLCHRLHSHLFSVHAGFITDPVLGVSHFDFTAENGKADYETAFCNFTEAIGELLDYAVPLEVKVAVENNVCLRGFDGHLLLTRASEFERLFAEIPSTNLGINLDLGHLNVSAKSLSFERQEFIETIKQKIFSVHLHDNDALTDSHQPLGVDSWIIPLLGGENIDEQAPLVLEMHNLTIDRIYSQIDLIKKRSAAR